MIRVLTANYNSTPYIHNLIQSLKNQSYGNWKCYIWDDCSTDGSFYYIQDLIKDDNRFILHQNDKHYYPCGNHYEIMQKEEIKNNDSIIAFYDGDDWLPLDDNQVFNRIINYFKDPKILMSFGQFKIFSGNNREMSGGFTRKPEPFNKLRQLEWSTSHLRCFRSKLFNHIKKESLIDPDTNWYWSMAGDVAVFTPLIEMAGEDRILFTKDINYIYNVATNLNEHNVNLPNQRKCFKKIMAQEPYQQLKGL